MREVTKSMIKEFNLRKLGYDFMGYTFKSVRDLSFHHLIIPKRLCDNLESKGYTRDNGAILKQSSSHEYLHTIELYDREMFLEITKQMALELEMGRLDIDALKRIRQVLLAFEREYQDKRNKNGKLIVKSVYKDRINIH